jgi:hypothetical protein
LKLASTDASEIDVKNDIRQFRFSKGNKKDKEL